MVETTAVIGRRGPRDPTRRVRPFEQGVLMITAPVKERAKSTHVPVQAALAFGRTRIYRLRSS
jgi:hypothetical protein